MSFAIPITAPPQEATRGPSLWELGAELQAETRWIAQLAERLHTEDSDDHARAVADLEECLAAEEGHREALERKADAVCWVIGRLRGDADYHQGQAKRFTALARNEASRADSLEASLLTVLTGLSPAATSFRLLDHKLTSRTADSIVIDDPEVIEGCDPLLVDGLLVGHQVVQTDAPMGTDLAEGNFALAQPLDQERPRHVQQISGLLAGELRMHRQQGDCISLGHLHQDPLEQLQDRRGKGHGGAFPVVELKVHAGAPQAMGAPDPGQIPQAGLSSLHHLGAGSHGLDGTWERHGHGVERGPSTPTLNETNAANAVSAEALVISAQADAADELA
jgi:hypothetical protein